MKLIACILCAGLLIACHRAPTHDEIMLKAAHDALKIGMVDPQSMQFQYETVGKDYVCGMVNSKNSFGGYTGFKAYVIPVRTNGDVASASTFDAAILGENATAEQFLAKASVCPGNEDFARGPQNNAGDGAHEAKR